MAGGKRALITGATSGIGAAFAERLAAEGHDLILTGRRREKIEAVAAGIAGRHGVDVRVELAELAEPADVDRLAALVEAEPDLETLVNNAGYASRAQFHRAPFAEHARMLDVHVRALLRLTHAALPDMLARGRGRIVNVSSMASFIPYPGNAMYSATKACVTNFSETLHLELAGTNVRVQALCPGLTRTDFHSRLDMDLESEHTKRELEKAMTAEQVVDCAFDCLARDVAVCIPGRINRLRSVPLKLLPRRAVYRIIARMFGDGSQAHR